MADARLLPVSRMVGATGQDAAEGRANGRGAAPGVRASGCDAVERWWSKWPLRGCSRLTSGGDGGE